MGSASGGSVCIQCMHDCHCWCRQSASQAELCWCFVIIQTAVHTCIASTQQLVLHPGSTITSSTIALDISRVAAAFELDVLCCAVQCLRSSPAQLHSPVHTFSPLPANSPLLLITRHVSTNVASKITQIKGAVKAVHPATWRAMWKRREGVSNRMDAAAYSQSCDISNWKQTNRCKETVCRLHRDL